MNLNPSKRFLPLSSQNVLSPILMELLPPLKSDHVTISKFNEGVSHNLAKLVK